VVSLEISLLKGEAPRFSADFTHPLSCRRPFNFPCHLVQSLGIDNIIAMQDININSAKFNNDMDTDTDKDSDKNMDKNMDKDREHGHGQGHRHRHGHRLGFGIGIRL
jgi:hypothetical protein